MDSIVFPSPKTRLLRQDYQLHLLSRLLDGGAGLKCYNTFTMPLEMYQVSWTTTSKLLEILNDPPKYRKLKMELTITIDAMEPFVKATYFLEGDGALALLAYERVSALFSVISTEHYPNVNGVAKQLAKGD